jgi:magnesium transporter
MENEFLGNTSIISYSNKNYEKTDFAKVSEINLIHNLETVKWLNTYGIKFHEPFKKIIQQNKLDDF